MAYLSASGITKRFGGVVALDGADFAAEVKEVHALLGENGAGKSTFIKVLTGAIHADQGEVVLDGEPFTPQNPIQAARAGVAAVFQELSLVPDMTVAQNIWFRREPRSLLRTISSRRLCNLTRELFTRFEFPPIGPDRLVRSLSIAERQVVEIAKAISANPRVLILDEATSALSPDEVGWLLGLARRLAQEGMLVIYISHRLGEVQQVADRLTIFRNGRNVGTRLVQETSEDEVISLMLGRRLEQLYPEKRSSAGEHVALRVRDLHLGHRLQGVDLDLREGEILGIGGLQGQGQLELFLSLFGVLHAHGLIEVGGKPVKIRSPRDAFTARIGLALVPEDRQNQGLLLPKSVRENLTLAVARTLSRYGFIDFGAEYHLVNEAVRSLNIALRTPEQPAGSLSGGNQQKVVVAKLLSARCRILLLYDLTRGVDIGTKSEIFRLMRRLVGEAYSILFFSTDMQELIHLSDRVAVLSDGRVAALLEGNAITEERIIRASIAHVEAA